MLGAEETTLWIVALGMGAVVILVVVVLLTMLVLLLRDTDASASSLVELARDRQAAPSEDGDAAEELGTAASLAKGLEQEILVHRELLSRR